MRAVGCAVRWRIAVAFAPVSPPVAAVAAAHALRTPRRWLVQSPHATTACRDLPRTPAGHNPYDVLEVALTRSTTLEDVSRQFRALVVQYHPDKPGGSTAQMSEINLAYTIVKEHHGSVLQRLAEAEAGGRAADAYAQRHADSARAARHADLSRRGGVASSSSAPHATRQRAGPTMASHAQRQRTLRELTQQWEQFRTRTEEAVRCMCNRYELAVEQGTYLRKSTVLHEVSARERWLRRGFIKGVWEDVHEMRAELLRRGARSAQQSEMAEQMVHVASHVQRQLNDNFRHVTQQCMQARVRLHVRFVVTLLLWVVLVYQFWVQLGRFVARHSLTVRMRPAMLGY